MYPNGWFRVAFSSELPRGGVQPLVCFGRDLVLFRGDDGEARVLDAHCPHMGAHLGHGGKVVGRALQCPFHGWRIGGDGACREVPFAKKIPARAEVRCWPVEEVNGVVFVHHDAEGRPPAYRIPALPFLKVEDGWGAGRSRRIRAPFSMLMENTVDSAHAPFLHDDAGFFEPMSVTRFETDDERLRVTVKGTTRLWKLSSDVTWEFEAHGPGFMWVKAQGVLDTIILFVSTPIEGDLVENAVMVFAPGVRGGAPVRRLVERAVARRVLTGTKRETAVWEHMRYDPSPLLSSADGPVMKFRAWVAQFQSTPAEPRSAAAERVSAPRRLSVLHG